MYVIFRLLTYVRFRSLGFRYKGKPLAARASRRPVPLNATASRSACFAKQIESARPDLALLAMGHNSKIGYPYLPAREPWRGRDVRQRAWRATLAGMAGESGGDGGRRWRGLGGRLWWGLQKSRGGRDGARIWATLAVTGRLLAHFQQELGGRLWRGRGRHGRARRTTVV